MEHALLKNMPSLNALSVCAHAVLFILSERVLQRTPSMDETGPVVWHLALCLLLAWILVGAALFKGIKSSGKVCVCVSELVNE